MSRRRARRDTGDFPDRVITPEGTTLSVLDSGRLIPPRGDPTFVFPETVEAPDGTEWLVEDERLTEPAPADDTDGDVATSIEDLVTTADPSVFDRTFTDADANLAIEGAFDPVAGRKQVIPRVAYVLNFNLVWNEDKGRWEPKKKDRILEDFEDPYRGTRYEPNPVEQSGTLNIRGDFVGRLDSSGGDDITGSTRDTILEAPIELSGWVRAGTSGAAPGLAFFTQDETNIPEHLNATVEAFDNTFEMNYESGDTSLGGSEFAITNIDITQGRWFRVEIDISAGSDPITATLFDEDDEELTEISGTPPTTLTEGGFGFNLGGTGDLTAFYDNYKVIG